VDDLYESYIDKESGNSKYVRKINEGGYVKTKRVFLINQTIVFWLKIIKIETKNFVTPKNTQDILSAFYYLRNYPNIDKISPGSLLPSICL
jgi:hypothetical protein